MDWSRFGSDSWGGGASLVSASHTLVPVWMQQTMWHEPMDQRGLYTRVKGSSEPAACSWSPNPGLNTGESDPWIEPWAKMGYHQNILTSMPSITFGQSINTGLACSDVIIKWLILGCSIRAIPVPAITAAFWWGTVWWWWYWWRGWLEAALRAFTMAWGRAWGGTWRADVSDHTTCERKRSEMQLAAALQTHFVTYQTSLLAFETPAWNALALRMWSQVKCYTISKAISWKHNM